MNFSIIFNVWLCIRGLYDKFCFKTKFRNAKQNYLYFLYYYHDYACSSKHGQYSDVKCKACRINKAALLEGIFKYHKVWNKLHLAKLINPFAQCTNCISNNNIQADKLLHCVHMRFPNSNMHTNFISLHCKKKSMTFKWVHGFSPVG
jgi:hypothetical protein